MGKGKLRPKRKRLLKRSNCVRETVVLQQAFADFVRDARFVRRKLLGPLEILEGFSDAALICKPMTSQVQQQGVNYARIKPTPGNLYGAQQVVGAYGICRFRHEGAGIHWRS